MSYYNPFSRNFDRYNTDRYYMPGYQQLHQQGSPLMQLRQPFFKSRPMSQTERRILPLQRGQNPLPQPLRQPRPLTQASKDQHALEQRIRSQAPRDDNSHVKKLRQPMSNNKQAYPAQQLRQPNLQGVSKEQLSPMKTQLQEDQVPFIKTQSPKDQPPTIPPTVSKPPDQLKETEQKSHNQANDEEKQTGNLDMEKDLAGVLTGVRKKVPRREWRRRLNVQLRRALRPLPALAALNEMLPAQMQGGLLKMDSPWRVTVNAHGPPEFSGEFVVNGQRYEGRGRSKAAARTHAAEQVFRDIMIERLMEMERGQAEGAGSEDEAEGEAERPLAMVQLASYALHRLFTHWEREGHRVPALQHPAPDPEAEECEWETRGARRRALPASASAMHPCALLALLRPAARYEDAPAANGVRVRLHVDGAAFVATAPSKRKARRQAARAACTQLFGVKFDEEDSDE